jgi:hypothetical protein
MGVSGNRDFEFMRFTLYYDGPLPSAANSARIPEKHLIRKSTYPQLAELFNREPNLPKMIGRTWRDWDEWDWPDGPLVWREENAVRFIGSRHFVPLVRKDLFLHCELDFLFLRHGEPGSIVTAGDIDNRLLTLSDGLCIPKGSKEIEYLEEQNDLPINDPIFCLLEDDSLITRWNIKTDRLLDSPNNPLAVRLIIEVKLKGTKLTWDNIDLLGD